MTRNYTFTRAKAGKMLGLAAKQDEDDTFEPSTCFVWLVPANQPAERWYSIVYPLCVQGITLGKLSFMPERRYIVLSAEGDIVFLLRDEDVAERIPESGLFAPDSRQFGRMQDIQIIGDYLFACGNGRQIYRRDGHRDGVWTCLAPQLRQPPEAPSKDVFLQRINGPQEADVYVAGSNGTLLHWNGAAVAQQKTGVDAILIDILVENDDRIWVCGGDATLLRGNHRDGFVRCPGMRGTTIFQSMAIFEGKLFLAASAGDPSGLFTYDSNRLRRVATGLSPEPVGPHIVDAADGFLWVVGLKDILRFDGARWERFDFPANDPVR